MNAYVSTELSMIQMLDPQRHELALLQEAFLSKGGAIEVLPFWVSRDSDAESKFRSMTPNFQASAVKEGTYQQAARLRKMAKTMNRDEMCAAEGISLGVLRGIGKRYNIDFPIGAKKGFAPNKATPELLDELAPKVQACADKGLSRNQCSKEIGISSTLLTRVINERGIDYPKRKAGPHPAFFAKQG